MPERVRCRWAGEQPGAMWSYHDTEWGVPTHDDRRHFEFMVLEGAQAGLSWSTILNKRAGYAKNFADFDPEKVARFTPAKVDKILQDPGVVRNRLKVESCVKNAKLFLAVQQELGSFDALIWSFVDGVTIDGKRKRTGTIPATTKQSDALGKALKQRGFTFCGSTIMYSHMQACGLVSDHLVDCFRYKEITGTSRTGPRRSA